MALFEIRGLYSGRSVVEADTEEAARKQYHLERPGWQGVIFDVQPVPIEEGV